MEKEPVCVFAAMSVPIPASFGSKQRSPGKEDFLSGSDWQLGSLSHGYWFVKEFIVTVIRTLHFKV